MFKKVARAGSILMLSVMSLLLMSFTAFGATVQSDPYETKEHNGHKYTFTSEIWERWAGTNKATIEAVSHIKTNSNVPVGYMGAQARLYNQSTGKLVASSTMKYNDTKISGWYVYSDTINTAGKYYSQTKAEFYNGNGYTSYTGYKSPYLVFQPKYKLNQSGESYGSGLSEFTVGEEPDLISAIGTNGKDGYVRANDLSPKISTIEEALNQANRNGEVRTIPLYDVDGKTVIGQFNLTANFKYIYDTDL